LARPSQQQEQEQEQAQAQAQPQGEAQQIGEFSTPAIPAATAEDAALVRRLLEGDEQTFTQLVQRFHGAMLRLARTMAGDASGAEEIVQETWTALLDSLPRFEGRCSLKTWVFRILHNQARTFAARAKRSAGVSWAEDSEADNGPAVDPQRFTFIGSWASPPSPWHARSPEELLLRKEVGAALAREIDALPPGQRAVVVLRDVEGCTSEEACSILGISDDNQRVLLHRGRSKLRTALERCAVMR
jgi:RNA polymerase sigma-70 factor (ECF subfamily)